MDESSTDKEKPCDRSLKGFLKEIEQAYCIRLERKPGPTKTLKELYYYIIKHHGPNCIRLQQEQNTYKINWSSLSFRHKLTILRHWKEDFDVQLLDKETALLYQTFENL